MAITRTQWIDDDGTGTTGTVINNAEKTLLYDQIDAALGALTPGAWVTPPYSAADYQGTGGMIWTVNAGDVFVSRYLLTGKLLTMVIALIGTSVSGTLTSTLQMRIPGGLKSNAFTYAPTLIIADSGGPSQVGAFGTASTPGGQWLDIGKLATGPLAAATDGTSVYGTLLFEVQ